MLLIHLQIQNEIRYDHEFTCLVVTCRAIRILLHLKTDSVT